MDSTAAKQNANPESFTARFNRLLEIMAEARSTPHTLLPLDSVRGPPKLVSHLLDQPASPDDTKGIKPLLVIATKEGSFYALYGITALLDARSTFRPTIATQVAAGLTATDVRSHYPLTLLAAHLRSIPEGVEVGVEYLEYVWRREGPQFKELIPILRRMRAFPERLLRRRSEIEEPCPTLDIKKRDASVPPRQKEVRITARQAGYRAVSGRRPTPRPPRRSKQLRAALTSPQSRGATAKRVSEALQMKRRLSFDDEDASSTGRNSAGSTPAKPKLKSARRASRAQRDSARK